MSSLSLETVISNIILCYVFYNFLIKIIAKSHWKSQIKLDDLIDQNQENYFKKIYLKQKLEYILMCVKEERKELNDKTEDLYKLIVEYEEYVKKEQEYIQINEDKDIKIQHLEEKNEKLFKIIFKFLSSFEKEIEEYKNRECEYKIREKKYLDDIQDFSYLALE
jgi:hypothetical protein|tara:strand:+ start:11436 stop:11927 length:492 start_codon:yes stop_codon:yes gene_type:complete